MKAKATSASVFALAVLVGITTVGCRDTWPHSATWVPGDLGRTHGEPAEGGYYGNWDPYAVEVEVKPVSDVNPVGTQHVLIATVKDADGNTLPARRVEWIIAEGSVGSFVEVDESGWQRSRGHKEDNKFAITHTNYGAHVLTRGNDDPNDDIVLEKGQTWVVITSPIEGSTNVIAYVPAIYNWDKHKVIVTKNWYDVVWELPPPAVNRIGTDHQLVTKVMRCSDDMPIEGYDVVYKILSGPDAVLLPGGGQTATVKTDAAGLGKVTLKQKTPAEGTNEIEVRIIRPADRACCKPAAHIYTGTTQKTWVSPSIAIKKTAPATAIVGQQFRYSVTVQNPGKAAARNVVVTDELPDGIRYVSSSPEATVAGRKLSWGFRTLDPKQSLAMYVTVQATRTGKFTNCADVKADDGLTARSCADTVVKQAKLVLEKTGPEEVILCDTITYRLTVRNTGGVSATNVQITDMLADGIKTVDDRQSVTISVGTLPAGGSKTYKLLAKASRTGKFTNRAEATADTGLKASATAVTTVRVPVLKLAKTGQAERYINRPVTYQITVRNSGDAEARNTVLTDMVPPQMGFVSATNGGTYAGGKITWNLGTLDPNESVTVSATLMAKVIGTASNRVSVSAYCAEAKASFQTKIKGIPAILLEAIDLKDPIEVGANETYVITVTNQGSADDTNIKIVCEFPDQQEYVSSEGPTRATVDGRKVTFAPLKSLAPKAKVTYRVVLKGVRTGNIRFKVTLTSGELTVPVQETESTNIYD